MKIILTKIYRSNKNKAGFALLNKQGKPYTRIAIQTNQHGDKWLSGFDNSLTSTWKEGMEVDIEVAVSGEYLNFKPIKESSDEINNRIEKIEYRVALLEEKVIG